MPLSDGKADPGERISISQAHMEDVARLCAIRVGGCEETGASTCRVEYADLRLCDLFDGVATGFDGRSWWWNNRDPTHTLFET